MNQKYLITVGYTRLAFDNAETAMRAYALLTESTPCDTAYIYGNEYKRPESLEGVEFVRKTDDVEIELKRIDGSKFALHLTENEFKEKCRVRPTEVEGDARLVEEVLVAKIEGPDADAPTDEPQLDSFI
ncbi:MAG TPA: hypothetical protein VJS30_19080 [Paraburkholderia sp.]|nr:hypothetical protein [Paraburkholderia sp.]